MGQPHLNSDQVLTYMSIRDVIRDWVGRGELFLLSPALDSDPFVRCLYLSRDIYNAITDLGEGVDERMGRLRARLEVFIKGEVVTVSIDPYRSRSAYMSRLDPHRREVWEVRDRSRPSLRVFRSFAEKDTFVALTWQWRSILGPLARLEPNVWPRMWPIEARRCAAAWRRRFSSYSPHTGSNPDEYLTNWFPIGDPSRWKN
jgi:hypothetical protein